MGLVQAKSPCEAADVSFVLLEHSRCLLWPCKEVPSPSPVSLQGQWVESEVEARAIQARLVTPDPCLIIAFTAVCRELGIEVRTTAGNDGIVEELEKAKYEGVLVDSIVRPILS